MNELGSQERSGTPYRRAFVLFAVLLGHLVLVSLMMRSSRWVVSLPASEQPLVLLALPRETPRVMAPGRPPRPRRPSRAQPPGESSPDHPAPAPSAPPAAPAPPDWVHEAELAARDSVAARERADHYRDLSGSITPAARLDRAQSLGAGAARHHLETSPRGVLGRHARHSPQRALRVRSRVAVPGLLQDWTHRAERRHAQAHGRWGRAVAGAVSVEAPASLAREAQRAPHTGGRESEIRLAEPNEIAAVVLRAVQRGVSARDEILERLHRLVERGESRAQGNLQVAAGRGQ